jgi:superfamily II DNA helicase RecQ
MICRIRDLDKTIPFVVLTATIKKYQIGLLTQYLEIKKDRKIFYGNIDRPELYYEAHRRKDGIWSNLDNLSIPVYEKTKDFTGELSKKKFTKVTWKRGIIIKFKEIKNFLPH